MKKIVLTLLIYLAVHSSFSQNEYKLIKSEPFELPKNEVPLRQFCYDGLDIMSITGNAPNTFSFKLFSEELKLIKEKNVNFKDQLGDGLLAIHNFIKFKDKSYLFLCNYQNKTKFEGISVLEFSPQELDFVKSKQDLFLSAKKIRMKFKYPTMNTSPGVSEWIGVSIFSASHGLFVSEDKTKFMCTYELSETDEREGMVREKIGIHVFDQYLKKLWGGEYAMPYDKEKMESLSYIMGNDGKAYFLIKVHNRSLKKEQLEGLPDFHYEVLVYEKGEPAPEIIALDLDHYFPVEHKFYETPDGKIVFGGMYSIYSDKKMNGMFVLKIDIGKESFGKVKKNYYTIPLETLNEYAPEYLKRSVVQPEKGQIDDRPVSMMVLRNIESQPDGSMLMIIEYYYSYLKTDAYVTKAAELYVFRLDSAGNQSWIRKIPKDQVHSSKNGYYVSFNSLVVDGVLHLFYLDHPDNFNLSKTQVPVPFNSMAACNLVAVKIDEDGSITKSNIKFSDGSKIDFGIRFFVEGENASLLRAEKDDRNLTMFVLKVN